MRKALAILFMVVGSFGCIMLWQSVSTYLALSTFVLTVYVANVFWVEVVRTDAWHYRLTSYYFEDDMQKLCRACPYWILVGLAVVFGIINVVFVALREVVYNLGYYPVVFFGWLIGLKPKYWSGLFMARKMKGSRENKLKVFEGTWRYYDSYQDEYEHKWRVPPALYICFMMGVALIMKQVMDIAWVGSRASVLDGLGWIHVGPALYGGIIALIVAGNVWQRGIWPTSCWLYRKTCPGIRFEEPAAEPAQPQRPSRPRAQQS